MSLVKEAMIKLSSKVIPLGSKDSGYGVVDMSDLPIVRRAWQAALEKQRQKRLKSSSEKLMNLIAQHKQTLQPRWSL